MGDLLAAGVVRAARAAGRAVPADVSVTGWDDAPVAAELGLTTVAQSLREQGRACARAALGEPHDGDAPWRVVRRGSTRDG
jgi:DNA-binding LacI/PurR family transcriptional regulator